MAIWFKEVLSAWKWILFFGCIIGLLLLTHQYILSGVNPNIMFIILPIIIALVCCSVILHRNITLNGRISVKVGFGVALMTFILSVLMGSIFSQLIFDIPLFRIFYSLDDVPRRYYSPNIDPDKIDFDSIQRAHIIQTIKGFLFGIFILCGISWLIAKVFSR